MNLNIENYTTDYHFSSSIFRSNQPQFLPAVRTVFEEYVKKSKNSNQSQSPVYPSIMTDIISLDERINPFEEYVDNIAWDILNSQGYNMDLFYTSSSEMWGQHHSYMSNMEHHIHGQDVQLCGLYFIDTPQNSSSLYIHDPRAVKIYAGLPERQSQTVTSAHNMVYYTPEPGDLIFTNAWLAHSFSRNQSQLPYNYIHINVRVAFREDSLMQQTGPIII